MTFLEDASGTMSLTERPNPHNTVGNSGRLNTSKSSVLIDGPNDQTAYIPALHLNKFNYLFVDGHTQTLSRFQGIGTGTLDAPKGVWSIDKGD